jgi:acyl-coenzyme A thioesterase PaaI-like protein
VSETVTDTETAPDGLQQLSATLAGELRAPMGEKLGFNLVEVERGRVVFAGTPDRSVYNPLGAVHGGYAATLLDSACGIAVHSQLEANRSHATLELKVSYSAELLAVSPASWRPPESAGRATPQG